MPIFIKPNEVPSNISPDIPPEDYIVDTPEANTTVRRHFQIDKETGLSRDALTSKISMLQMILDFEELSPPAVRVGIESLISTFAELPDYLMNLTKLIGDINKRTPPVVKKPITMDSLNVDHDKVDALDELYEDLRKEAGRLKSKNNKQFNLDKFVSSLKAAREMICGDNYHEDYDAIKAGLKKFFEAADVELVSN